MGSYPQVEGLALSRSMDSSSIAIGEKVGI